MRTRKATAASTKGDVAVSERSRRVPKRPAETPAEPAEITEHPVPAQPGADQSSGQQVVPATAATSSSPPAPLVGSVAGSLASPAGSGSPTEPAKKRERGRPRGSGKAKAANIADTAQPQGDQAAQAAIVPPLQGNLSDAENAALQQKDAAQMEAARAAGKVVDVGVHLYDPGDLHMPVHLHIPNTATVSFLKREIERMSGVMPRYQQVDIREPGSTQHWTLPEHDCTGQQACLSQFFDKKSTQYTVYCSFLPHTPERPETESHAAATLLAIQGVPDEVGAAAGQNQDQNAQAAEQATLQPAVPQNPGAALPIAQPKRKPKSPSHQRPNNTKAGPWSAEEIEQLIVAMEHVPYGKWAKVQSEYHFGHRSQVDLKDKWRNLAHAVVYKKQTRRVWLSDEQKERIIRCLPQYNPDQVSADQRATVPAPEQPAVGAQPAGAVQGSAPGAAAAAAAEQPQHQPDFHAQQAPSVLPPDLQQHQVPQQQQAQHDSFVSQLQAPEQHPSAAAIALQQLL